MSLIGVGVLLILLGGASAIVFRRYVRVADAAFALPVVAGCILAASAAVRTLSGGQTEAWALLPTLPGGVWVLTLDELSAWFLLLLAIVGGITTVFGVSYLQREQGHRSVASVHATWAVLLAAMMGVLLAQSAVLFLLTWEVMAASAYFLILFEHDHEEARRSGLVYLVLTHLGTLGLLVMFISWGSLARDFSFASLAAAGRTLPWAGAAVLLLALFGFGIKAGVFPFHFWLPGAHAAAPSHVSALLSGVMLKMGIYGLFRILTLVGPAPAWWGWTVLLLGLASAFLGVLWALAQQDIKRALAYSSVENIGIILLGIGLGVLGTAYHRPTVALLGFAGALLHALNHALFKSLLFLGAGTVVHATGTREIDRLGGLARLMPRTTFAFLVGSIAIIGLPPLNGFVSEWTLIRGFLDAGGAAGPLRWTSLGAAGIGLVGALALACFARLAGMVFLGQPRDRAINDAGDVGSGMVLPMYLLGVACLSIGLAPTVALGLAMRVAAVVAGPPGVGRVIPLASDAGMGLQIFGLSMLFLVMGAWVLRVALLRRSRRRSAATWGCAFPEPTARMQYTAASFSLPLLKAVSIPAGLESSHASGPLRMSPQDRILRNVARPFWDKVQALALSVRPLQQGRVTTYLQYMIWTVLALLGFLLFTSTGGQP